MLIPLNRHTQFSLECYCQYGWALELEEVNYTNNPLIACRAQTKWARGSHLQCGEWNWKWKGKSNHVRTHVCAQGANCGGIMATVSHHSQSTLPICLSLYGEAATLCQWWANPLSSSVTVAVIGKYNKQILNREMNCRSVPPPPTKNWCANNNKCIPSPLVIPVVAQTRISSSSGGGYFGFHANSFRGFTLALYAVTERMFANYTSNYMFEKPSWSQAVTWKSQ